MRHLGGLGFLFFWLLAGSGLYLFVRLDTSSAGAYGSITGMEWWLGGVLRSVHRYAADAFVLAMLAHVLREGLAGRFRGFRTFTWITGLPALGLLFASGLVGYWLVWDARAQFSFQATLEALGLGERGDAAPDRLFSLFVFLHIGLPLALLGAMWIHVVRLSGPRTRVPRRMLWAVMAILLGLAALRPADSEPHWDPGAAPRTVAVDWFYQFAHPFMYGAGLPALWALVAGAAVFLLLLPWLGRPPVLAAAVVHPAECNGCGRCVADCPYQAVLLEGKLARVDASRCAACGICAGACPSSTPFRGTARLATGIDLPDLPVDALRERLRAVLASGARKVAFACDQADAPAHALRLRCLAMLPPAFVDYALRHGADRVDAHGCGEDCAYRLGAEIAGARFDGTREPHLRGHLHLERHDHAFTFHRRGHA